MHIYLSCVEPRQCLGLGWQQEDKLSKHNKFSNIGLYIYLNIYGRYKNKKL